MPKQILALASCRVSSLEQLDSNSLNRQRSSVEKAAADHDAIIPVDGWWSGSVSSKRGTNVDRKDLTEMLERCKKDKRIKYIIVDEVDRFMRSMLEIGYFIVEFQKLGVRVVFASQPNIKTDTAVDTLLLMLEAYKAEGSNEERQHKSIAGQTKALQDGRYPFSPKPGYKRGYERGIQEIHPLRGPALRNVLVRLAIGLTTPTKALIELNQSDFMQGHAIYKMDKFRKIATDPFYAGMVEINKQVQVRNPNGLHEPLVTIDQHNELLKIFDAKTKTQTGPRKNGNPKYPLSNLVTCDRCLQKSNGRFVGFDHSNGKPNGPTYEKYRCRACGRYVTREAMHSMIESQFKDNPVTPSGRDDFLKALDIVWKREEENTALEIRRLRHKAARLKQDIDQQVEAATDPSNLSIKNDILALIERKKTEISALESRSDELIEAADEDREQFLKFAFEFVDNMSTRFLYIPPENRLQCKDAIFPAGFYLNDKNRVYTPEKSELIRLASNKKAQTSDVQAHLVRVTGL